MNAWKLFLFLATLFSGVLCRSALHTGFAAVSQVNEHMSGYDRRSFFVDGKPKILRGGTLQWWRLPEREWEDRVQRFKAHGFNTVDLYVPWNIIEPKDGVFQFDHPHLTHFMDLLVKYEIYVYLRPGPYITNEMDGGGSPAWLIPKTSKAMHIDDGKVTLRANDPDYLYYVERYFRALGKVLAPYMRRRGGPIILASVENEYNWFERVVRQEKSAKFLGVIERPIDFDPQTKEYLENLARLLREAGFDVPVTTCPGDAQVSGTGNARGIIPAPNIYKLNKHERYAYETLKAMRDPRRFEGAYVDMPSLSTETDRTPAVMKRLIMGGFDGYFGFGMVAYFTPGRFNSLTLNPDVRGSFEFNFQNVVTGFFRPRVGLMNHAIDFYGSVTASGVLRKKYFSFRRANAYLDLFESWIARQEFPIRAVLGAKDEASRRLQVQHPKLGSQEDDKRVFYWFEGVDGQKIFHLVNETGRDLVLKPGDITLDGQSYPRYTTLMLTKGDYEGPPDKESIELHETSFLSIGILMKNGLKISHTTSEILAIRQLRDESLLVVNGPDESEGEISLEWAPGTRVLLRDASLHIRREHTHGLELSYQHQGVKSLKLENSKGDVTTVLIMDRSHGSRLWFLKHGREEFAVAGLDYIVPKARGDSLTTWSFEHSTENPEIVIYPKKGNHIANAELIREDQAGLAHYQIALSGKAQILDGALNLEEVLVLSIPEKPPSSALKFEGSPKAAENLGFQNGSIWYRSDFEITEEPSVSKRSYDLYVPYAADIINLYVNDHYISTFVPLGTEINSKGGSFYYFPAVKTHLKKGLNSISFQADIWGHGSFMSPMGTMFFFPARIPALGFDAPKGLIGRTQLDDIPLDHWQVWAGLSTEPETKDKFVMSRRNAQLPLKLPKGGKIWLEGRIDTAFIPDPKRFFAPLAMEFKGVRLRGSFYLDGQLLGRWISDNEWLRQGTWIRPMRDHWGRLSPDDFPLGVENLKGASVHRIQLLLEDSSGFDKEAGVLQSAKLKFAQEDYANDSSKIILRSRESLRGQIIFD